MESSRAANDETRSAARRFEAPDGGADQVYEFLCECGCRLAQVKMPLSDFDRLRAAGKPVLAGGHAVSAADPRRRGQLARRVGLLDLRRRFGPKSRS